MRLTISFDEQDHTLYAELKPSEESEEISLLSIKKRVEEAGYHNLTLNPQAIPEILTSVQQAKECKVALKTLVDATAEVTAEPAAQEAES